MVVISELIKNAQTIGIAGHVNPDGDCVGSCLGLYMYLKQNFPEKEIRVFLEEVIDNYRFIHHWEEAEATCGEEELFDVFFALDCGDPARIGVAYDAFMRSGMKVCIDHHISNTYFGQINEVYPNSSSTSEVIYELIMADDGEMTRQIAESLYVGIVQDTGVFQYSCTGKRTMEIAGILMNYGIAYSNIIEETFFMKSYEQNRIMGEALVRSRRYLDDRMIVSSMTREDLVEFGVEDSDLAGIVSQLRNTKGVEVSAFLHQVKDGSFRVSMRSRNYVDVSAIAVKFGGGGHVRASGFSINGTPEEITETIVKETAKQMKQV